MSPIGIKRKLHNYSMQEWNKVNIPIPKGNNWRIATNGQTKANQISILQKLAPKALVIWQSLCGVVEPPLPWDVACSDFICYLQHSLSECSAPAFFYFLTVPLHLQLHSHCFMHGTLGCAFLSRALSPQHKAWILRLCF